MERELSWHELTEVIEAHEAYHNYMELRRFCDLYYPTATRIVVYVVQAYDDNNYYNTFGPSNLTAYDGDREMHLPTDDVALLVLLAASAELKDAFADAKPERPIDWLEEGFHDDVYNLELCGIEKGYDVEVDLTSPPPLPWAVYVKEGDERAVLADG